MNECHRKGDDPITWDPAFYRCGISKRLSEIDKSMKTWLSLSIRTYACLALLTVVMADSARAQFNFATNNGTITITRFLGSLSGAVTVPDITNGMAVTDIGPRAFWYITSMSSVTIPDSVTSIEDSAFLGCSSLTNVVMGNSVTNLGYGAFYNCSSLPGVEMPDSIVNMGAEAFHGCASLTTITIPNSVTNIPVNAFNSCTSLTNLTFGSNTVSIGEGAFSGCSSLRSLTIAGSVTNLQGHAFEGCTSLADLTLGSNIINIGEFAFSGCSSLKSLTIPDSVTNIGGSAFVSCTSLSSVTIPKSVSSIGEYAFGNCWRLTNITVNPLNSVYSSVDGVLFDKNQTTLIQYPEAKPGSYVVPTTVTSIVEEAFGGTPNLTSVTLPKSVISFGEGPFGGCYNLTNITVDPLNSVYSSVDGVLFDKNQTTLIQYPEGKPGSYVIPGSVANIGFNAFFACGNLPSITIPNSVTNIGAQAFANCASLSSVTVPNSVTSIGDSAFVGCSSLTNVIIPVSVTFIGDQAFRYCYQLATVYFQGDAPAIESTPWTVFDQDTNIVYYLPGTSGWDSTYCDRPTLLWTPQLLASDVAFGIRTNQFRFEVNWASGRNAVVETTTNLNGGNWIPLQTNTLANGLFYFSDPTWSNYPVRFYRVTSP